jgi:hypothetical protein
MDRFANRLLPQHVKKRGYGTIGTGKIFDPRNVEGDWNGPQDAISSTEFFGKDPFNPRVGGPTIGGHDHDPAPRDLVAELTRQGNAKGLGGKELRSYVRPRGGGPEWNATMFPATRLSLPMLSYTTMRRLHK